LNETELSASLILIWPNQMNLLPRFWESHAYGPNSVLAYYNASAPIFCRLFALSNKTTTGSGKREYDD
jgi:hypothetical protein